MFSLESTTSNIPAQTKRVTIEHNGLMVCYVGPRSAQCQIYIYGVDSNNNIRPVMYYFSNAVQSPTQNIPVNKGEVYEIMLLNGINGGVWSGGGVWLYRYDITP